MEIIAIKLKALNLYAHMAHNLVSGISFFQDHEFFSSVYEKADDFYDSVVERMIGIGLKPDLKQINKDAVGLFSKMGNDYFPTVLAGIKSIQSDIDKECEDNTEAVKQLLGGISDELDMLVYKIKQRVG